jgi:hypothetical protein
VKQGGVAENTKGGTGASSSRIDGVGNGAGRVNVRWIARNPMLALALLSLLLRHGLPLILGGVTEGVVGLLWTSAVNALRAFSLVATWVDPYLRGFPEFVDWVVTLMLGLIPYVVVDALYRRYGLSRNASKTRCP